MAVSTPRFPPHRVSEVAMSVVVFHWRPARSKRGSPPPTSHLCYTVHATPQRQTRVKLNRVFFPRCFCQARSLGCGFAR